MPAPYEPNLYRFRVSSTEDSAIILVHGIGGHPERSWSRFVAHVQSLTTWDLLSFGYPTRLATFGLEFMQRLPSFETVATSLATAVRTNAKRYRRLAVVTHGEGGLVFQRAYLNDSLTRRLVTHAMLIASPNTGQASFVNIFGLANRQVREAQRGSAFIKALRADWDAHVGADVPFILRAVVAEQDNLVPADVAHAGFAPHHRDSVPGDHFSAIQPASDESRVCRLVADLLRAPSRVAGTRVFLSYAREDQSIVEAVYGRFLEVGLDPWMDIYHLQLGREWEKAIDTALAESHSVLVFISRATTQALAEHSFLHLEMRRSLELALSQQRRLVPIQLDDTPIPSWIGKFQGMRLRGEDDLTRLVNEMQIQLAQAEPRRGRPSDQ